MAMNPSVNKRLKEKARQDKREDKRRKKLQKMEEKTARPDAPAGVDPDIAHIVPGPQAPLEP